MEGNINPNQNKNFSKEEAIEKIRAIQGEWGVVGGIDSEIDETNLLITKLERGEVSAEKALEEIQRIDNLRMDYH